MPGFVYFWRKICEYDARRRIANRALIVQLLSEMEPTYDIGSEDTDVYPTIEQNPTDEHNE